MNNHAFFSRRLTALLLAAIFMLQCVPATALATASDGLVSASASNGYGIVKPYIFRWGDDDLPRDAEATCYYADTFFEHAATEYNPSLATASACLAMASGASSELGTPIDYKKQDKNGIAFLNMLGFENAQSNADFKAKPRLDSIGCVVGYKVIDGTPLIAVGIRGCNYMAEWGGNFTIGSDAALDHKGFEEAADSVVSFLESYIQSDGFLANYGGEVKVWIAGYSRAGATSNLTAAKLVRTGSVDGKSLPPKNIYAYCFETPSGGLLSNRTDGKVYDNIFNIINAHDMVPMVAPAAYSFAQYGVKKILPTRETDANYAAKRDFMLSRYERAGKYSLDDFVSYQFKFGIPPFEVNRNGVTSQAVFMDGFINHLAKAVIGDRNQFAEQLQNPLRQVVDVLMGKGNMTSANAWKLIKRTGYNFMGIELLHLINAWHSGTWNDVAVVLIRVIQKSAKELGLEFDVNTLVRKSAPNLFKLLLKLFISAPNWMLTLIKDTAERSGITQGHSLLLAKTWLECMDPCYVPNDSKRLNPEDVFLNGEYRLVRIASDQSKGLKIDVLLNDGSGTAIASMEEGTQSGALTAEFSAQKEYVYYLPTNATYTIRITGNADGKVQYSVSEYNPNLEPSAAYERIKRICWWNDIELKKAAVLTGALPVYKDDEIRNGAKGGSSCIYTLEGIGGQINPTGDKRGAELNSAYHTVTITEAPLNNASVREDPTMSVYGFAWGEDTYLVGTNAGVHAMPVNGGRFIGWYENGTQLSAEPDYAYPVLESLINTPHELTAQFGCGLTPQNLTAENVNGGIKLTWEDYAAMSLLLENIAGYKIYRDGKLLTELKGSSCKDYRDTPVAAGETYVYTVSAYDGFNYTDITWGESPQSEAVSIKAGGPIIVDQTLSDGAENAPYSETLQASGQTPITWRIIDGELPVGLRLSESGVFSGTPVQAGLYTFTVEAANAYGTDIMDFSIAVRSLINKPVIATAETGNTNLGDNYDLSIRALGYPKPTFRKSAGDLPTGLSMDNSGHITGTPCQAGAYTFSVTAENEFGADTRAYCIVICYVNGAPVIATPTLPSGSTGAAYDAQLEFFGLDPVYWSVEDGELPPGLSLDERTGMISGTPTASGSYTFTVRLDNAISFDTRSFTVQIGGKGGSTTASSGVTANAGAVYVFTQSGVWQKDGGLRFALDVDCEKLVSVLVDGNMLEKKDYTLVCGSTIITLHKDYLSTLGSGKHTLCVYFTDGKAETTFYAAENPLKVNAVVELPATGTPAQLPAFLLLCCAVLLGSAMIKRKRSGRGAGDTTSKHI